MKKNYMIPQSTVVEMTQEDMIAQTTLRSVGISNIDGGVDAVEGLVREDVSLPKHDAWEEW